MLSLFMLSQIYGQHPGYSVATHHKSHSQQTNNAIQTYCTFIPCLSVCFSASLSQGDSVKGSSLPLSILMVYETIKNNTLIHYICSYYFMKFNFSQFDTVFRHSTFLCEVVLLMHIGFVLLLSAQEGPHCCAQTALMSSTSYNPHSQKYQRQL